MHCPVRFFIIVVWRHNTGNEGMALFGNVGEFVETKESWAHYAERFEQFFDANNIAVDRKKCIFLATIGPAANHTLGNLVAPKKPQEETYAQLLGLISTYYNYDPKPLPTMQRYKFYNHFRQSNEIISSFVAELRSLSKDCDFGVSLEENLCDHLVWNCWSFYSKTSTLWAELNF